MRRLLAVLMTVLLVTSAAGAAMVIGTPAQEQAEVTFDGCEAVSVDNIDVNAFANAEVELRLYDTSSETSETVTYDSSDVGGAVEIDDDNAGVTIMAPDGTEIESVAFVGGPLDGQTFENDNEDCGEPEVDTSAITLTHMCTDFEDDLAKFRVMNQNDVAVSVDYDVYGTDQSGTLDLNASETKYFTVETNEEHESTARLKYDGEVITQKASNSNEVEDNVCDLGPSNAEGVDIDYTCTVDGADATVTNDNDVAVTVEISGDASLTETLEAGESMSFEDVPDGEYTVTTLDGEEVVGEETVTIDCPDLVEVVVECGDDGATAEVTNPNDVAVTIEVSGDASLTETIEAGQTITFESVADGEYNVTTLVDEEEVGTQTVTIDCADDGDDGADDGDDSDDGADDGDDSDNGDDGSESDMPAYQIDVAAGDVIENLGVDGDDADDMPDFYGTQGRLLQAQSVLENGTVTGSYMVPGEAVTKDLDGCDVTYTPVSYDADTGAVTLDVSVSDGADCEGVTLTLAGYELPGDDTEFVRANADGQELVDYRTVTLGAGESGTVTIDLNGDS